MPKRTQPTIRSTDAAAPQAVIDRAVEVLGDRNTAFHWLGMPVPALGYKTPIATAATPEGEQAVLDVLGQIEHGVF